MPVCFFLHGAQRAKRPLCHKQTTSKQYQLHLLAGSEGPDQPARIRRLIWACVDRKYIRALFAHHIKYCPFTSVVLEEYVSYDNSTAVLHSACWTRLSTDDIFIFFFSCFSQKMGFDHLCKLSLETIFMKG